MPSDLTRAEATLAVPAAKAYAALADYRTHHPRILPRPPFEGLTVLEGGVGAGTVLEVATKAFGRRDVLRMAVSEPEPGRVLREAATDGTVTHFTVEPLDAASCRVTIETRWPTQRLLRNLLVAPVYRKELRLLGEYAATL